MDQTPPYPESEPQPTENAPLPEEMENPGPSAPRFHITDILSVTTGRVLSVNYVTGLFNVLSYMTDTPVAMRDREKALAACRPVILEAMPALQDVTAEGVNEESWPGWVRHLESHFGPEHPLPRLEDWHGDFKETFMVERENMALYKPPPAEVAMKRWNEMKKAREENAEGAVNRAASLILQKELQPEEDLQVDESWQHQPAPTPVQESAAAEPDPDDMRVDDTLQPLAETSPPQSGDDLTLDDLELMLDESFYASYQGPPVDTPADKPPRPDDKPEE